MSALAVEPTGIDGLFHVTLDVHGDSRGWFKESYQREKLEALGLPRLDAVQNNVSYNEQAGVTRGIHAEPWEKYISPAWGRVFAAIVDLREGDGFGRVETFELTPASAIFVPRGCGNSFCTLEPRTVYSYLVNEHWRPGGSYPAVDLFDTDLAVAWPLPRDEMVISDKDANNPPLSEVTPVAPVTS
ncbi:MAG: dTDP-4-dehydrorhamnose 3,5-epimerase [Frankiales bacterium]|nr:dTDP-4-dehydrorhamnose 3,5-epimerase [Frankiales bacterium]